MKNSFINMFKSKVKLNIKGKNIERFIRRIIKNNISIISLEQVKYNEINLIIYLKDLEKIEEIKTIYDLNITRCYGFLHLKKYLDFNKYLFLFIIIGIIIIYILSNMIFSVEVVHSDSNIRKFIKQELKKYGIDKYNFKKDYHSKEKIKQDLLNKYKDKLEWIEIETHGTKYIIKLEERKINKDKKITNIQNVVAKKDGIIISVKASNGEIVKNTNDYVKKGDVIISGDIYLNEELKNSTSAKGIVYAEVWYTVNISYPFHYKKTILLNDKNNIFTVKFLNKYYNLYDFKKFKTKKINDDIIFKNNIIPISFIKQNQIKTNEIDKIYTEKQAINEAIKCASKKIVKKKDSKILNYRILSKEKDNNKIKLKIFFSVKEDITDYQKIIHKEIEKTE